MNFLMLSVENELNYCHRMEKNSTEKANVGIL